VIFKDDIGIYMIWETILRLTVKSNIQNAQK